jgi:protein AATF/BFR2
VQRLRALAAKHKRAHIDQKASKARKVRYEIYKRLVNYMPPVDTQTWSEPAKDELFKSLFA